MDRRIAGLLVVAVVLGPVTTAQASGWGVGGFGGVSIPIAQDDAENGVVFGGRLKLSLAGILGIEPNFTYFRNGDWEVDDIEGTFEGSKFSSVGINLLLGGAGPVRAIRFVPFVGAKYYSEDTDLRDTESRIGWNAGLGLEIGAGNVGIEARGSFELMTLKDGGSRKWGHVTGGLNLYFGVL